MMDLLDAMSELVYIVDIDTYELLYMNTSGKEQFKLSSLDGLKCHKVIQGKDSPCEFCTTPYLKADSFYTWETANPVTGRHYLLKDKLFPWNGKNARIEIAFDMTEKQEALEAEMLLVSCVEVLQLGGPFHKTVESVLQKLGDFSGAERTYAFETEGTRAVQAYEWCAPGFFHCAEQMQEMDFGAPEWERFWGSGKPVEVYSAQESVSESLVSGGPDVRIAAVGSSTSHTPHLRMVLKTLANFMTSVLRAQRYQSQLERLSFIDTLTGAFNRNAFIQDMEKDDALVGCPIGVVQLSVNGIKDVNDRYGKEYGDRVLINTARKLREVLDAAKVYRIGGDEFVAVWKGAGSRLFEESVRRIKAWQEQELTAKFALGYEWSGDCVNPQTLVAQAEERMYRDKKDYYRDTALPKRYRSTNDKVLDFADEKALNRMLSEQRFTIYFQPKFYVSEQRLIGAEALVRFLTEAGQLLPPDQFIPFLEEARLIDRVDFYVFGHVCAKLDEWMKQGRKIVPVSVNFSRYTIREPWFRARLQGIWEKYQVPKEYLEIEITESAGENGGDELLDLLAELRQDGFSVSIDDFGVKYANLSVFTNGSFSTLKIDKSLVSDWENPRTREVLRALCDICQNTEVCLIAEGVESPEQLEFLRQIRCEGVQGFLFSQPLPQREFERRYL